MYESASTGGWEFGDGIIWVGPGKASSKDQQVKMAPAGRVGC